MKYYLSSYKFGNDSRLLKQLFLKGRRIGHIDNAKDSFNNKERRLRILREEMDFFDAMGFSSEHLDLKKYFHKEQDLRVKISLLDGIWISGGNTFVLRQAMRLSGFDKIYEDLRKSKDFVWGGYSAGICVLSDSLKYIQIVDDPYYFPYDEISETIWEGLNLFSYGLLPHFESDHDESAAIGLEVLSCIENKWLFKVLKDGEVIILED